MVLLLACSSAGADRGAQEPPVRFETGPGPDAMALIIAVSDYGAPPAGMKNARGQDVLAYRPLNAKNDVPLIERGLLHHGFPAGNIQVLADSAADRPGIEAAFGALIDAAGPGDVVVVHYSGHGHQLTDDDGPQDELDGYDEVLVPYGAPAELVKGYTGEYHLRDDRVGEVVRALREKVGAEGSVTFFLDACYSGTGTRGEDALPTRGMPEPLGEPNPAAMAAAGTRGADANGEEGSGFDVEAARPGTRGMAGEPADENGLAPFTVISAASHDEVAHETYADDGATVVGSLSYALASALPRLRAGDSYNTLFTYVVSALHGRVRQTPQIEGARDAVVFRPEFVRGTAPSVRVERVAADGRVVLDAGGLVGLNPGARVSLYAPGGDVAELEPWALGTVEMATPSRAVVVLDAAAPDVELLEARVFAERLAYGEATLRVALAEALPAVVADSIRQQLADIGMVEFVTSAPDVRVGVGPAVVEPGIPAESRSAKAVAYADRLAAATVNEGVPLSPAVAGPRRAPRAPGAGLVARRIEDWARNQYLRRIQFEDPGIDVDFELAVVRWDEATQSCTRPDWERADAHPGYQGGGRWSLPANTDYVLRVRNNGDEALHFAVIDLMPPGDTVTFVKPLYPRETESAQATELPPGGELQIPETCFYTEPTSGLETLKLFVSTEPVPIDRLVGMRTRSGTRGGSISMTATREIHLRTASGGQ
jgi:hypothetical protein